MDKNELELGATPASLEELAAKGNRPKVRIDKLLRDAAEQMSEGMIIGYEKVVVYSVHSLISFYFVAECPLKKGENIQRKSVCVF